jgi:hypothetical protein
MASLLKMDPAGATVKPRSRAAGAKPGLRADNANADDILDAILASSGAAGGRVSSTPATKTDVVALQVRGARGGMRSSSAGRARGKE